MTRSIKRPWLLLLTLIIAIGMCAPVLSPDVYAASKKPAKVKGVKVTNVKTSGITTTAVKVTWKKAKKAKKYQVQYKKKSAKKWKTYKTVKSRSVKITKLTAAAKYDFRIRGIKGKKKGKWSKTVTRKTLTITPWTPEAVWPTRLDNGTIKVEWPGVSSATYYKAVCKDINSGGLGTEVKTVKTTGTKASFTNLMENNVYSISVKAYNGSKACSGTAVLTTSTTEGMQYLQQRQPTSVYYEMYSFTQKNGYTPGDEHMYPVLYATYYDSEGDVSSDTGFYFPKYIDVEKSITIYDAELSQYNRTTNEVEVKDYKDTVNGYTFTVGDEITDFNGVTREITGFRITLDENEDRVRDCSGYEEAFDYIDDIMIEVFTKPSSLYPLVFEYDWN